MRHGVDGRYFGRNTSHRRAMFRNLANSLIEQEQLVTTVQKAKEARRVVERLITLGKAGNQHSRRLAFDRTRSKFVVEKLFSTLAERYRNRAGGYTRILKMNDRRRGDGAEMALLELVDHPAIDRKRKPKAGVAAANADAQTGEAADPLKKFKKLFKRSNREGKSAKMNQETTRRAPAVKRKTSAAKKGGSSGGSSS